MANTDSARDAAARVIDAAAKGTPPRELRATYASGHAGYLPGGALRTRPFPGRLSMRETSKDGRPLYEVEGYATVFDRGYEMWDMFGSYTETVGSSALDRSLAAVPDVAFLVNHRGVTMARTTNESLTLEKDMTGLHCLAFLNAERQDVRDLASAIGDQLVDEMSFAFMLNQGEWNDDYSEFKITEADINRGDVSAVNYGANPYTSIQARSADWLADIERVPEVVARAAYDRIRTRLREREAPAGPLPDDHRGKSVKLWQVRLSS